MTKLVILQIHNYSILKANIMERIGELDMTIPALTIMNEHSNGITTQTLLQN